MKIVLTIEIMESFMFGIE